MALTDFFRINLPYGIEKNNNGEWIAFNRGYAPLGWNQAVDFQKILNMGSSKDLPIASKYKNASEVKLKKLLDEFSAAKYDSDGKLKVIYFYNDDTNPASFPKYWSRYAEKLKILSELKIRI
jgi:hypothetical protein